MSVMLPAPASCSACGFTTLDSDLLRTHNCDVQSRGGQCEDFPCCGHEFGDCNGARYGSDAAIKERVYRQLNDPSYDPYYDQENY